MSSCEKNVKLIETIYASGLITKGPSIHILQKKTYASPHARPVRHKKSAAAVLNTTKVGCHRVRKLLSSLLFKPLHVCEML